MAKHSNVDSAVLDWWNSFQPWVRKVEWQNNLNYNDSKGRFPLESFCISVKPFYLWKHYLGTYIYTAVH